MAIAFEQVISEVLCICRHPFLAIAVEQVISEVLCVLVGPRFLLFVLLADLLFISQFMACKKKIAYFYDLFYAPIFVYFPLLFFCCCSYLCTFMNFCTRYCYSFLTCILLCNFCVLSFVILFLLT